MTLQQVVTELNSYLTMEEIEFRLDHRVSARTLRRYKAGSNAKNTYHKQAIENLLIAIKIEKGEKK